MVQKLFKILGVSFLVLAGSVTVFLVSTGRSVRDAVEMLPLGVYSISEQMDFDGYTLNVRDYGKGKPTVIIEPGLNCGMHWYYELQMDLSKSYRTLCYNHPGIGNSTMNENPRTLPYYVAELKALMHQKQLTPPFVLIGHSLGGHIIRYYAHLYPDEVAGLVFIDDTHEDWFTYVRHTWNAADSTEYFNWWNPEINVQKYRAGGLSELREFEANCDSIRGIEIPSHIPVLMFTGNTQNHYRTDSLEQRDDKYAWAKLQAGILTNVTTVKHVIDWETGHSLHRDKPHEVQAEIKDFIQTQVKY